MALEPAAGTFVLRLAAGSAPATITATTTHSRDHIFGLPVVLLIAVGAVAYLGATATTRRRHRTKPVVAPPTHEHY